MLKRQPPPLAGQVEGATAEEAVLHGQSMSEEPASDAGWGQENPGAKGGRQRTKAGMSLKGKDISIYHRPIKDLEIGGERFCAGDAGGKPKSPKFGLAAAGAERSSAFLPISTSGLILRASSTQGSPEGLKLKTTSRALQTAAVA
jgi:hypothetical protein